MKNLDYKAAGRSPRSRDAIAIPFAILGAIGYGVLAAHAGPSGILVVGLWCIFTPVFIGRFVHRFSVLIATLLNLFVLGSAIAPGLWHFGIPQGPARGDIVDILEFSAASAVATAQLAWIGRHARRTETDRT